MLVRGGMPLVTKAITPIDLDKVDPARLVVIGQNSIYESFTMGRTLVDLDTIAVQQGQPDVLQNAVAYGGRRNCEDNGDVLYVGVGRQFLVRTTNTARLQSAPS